MPPLQTFIPIRINGSSHYSYMLSPGNFNNTFMLNSSTTVFREFLSRFLAVLSRLVCKIPSSFWKRHPENTKPSFQQPIFLWKKWKCHHSFSALINIWVCVRDAWDGLKSPFCSSFYTDSTCFSCPGLVVADN